MEIVALRILHGEHSEVSIRKEPLRKVANPPDQLERAISIRQPYVERILVGPKTREFRSRPTRIRGRVYLYAGLMMAEGPRVTSRVAACQRDSSWVAFR